MQYYHCHNDIPSLLKSFHWIIWGNPAQLVLMSFFPPCLPMDLIPSLNFSCPISRSLTAIDCLPCEAVISSC